MKRFLILAIGIFLSAAISYKAQAQRTAYGTVEVHGSVLTTLSSFGGEIGAGQYFQRSYVGGGVSFTNRLIRETTHNEKVNVERITAFADWMYRPYGTRDRKFSLYVGGDIFIGYERMDLFNQATKSCLQSLYNIGYSKQKVIYGFSPRVEGELFIAPQWAIIFPIRVPLTFNTQVGIFGFEIGVGARCNF